MNEKNTSAIPSPAIVAKAGLWYTVCTFIFKAMAFLTTPFFARYMSKSELGGFTDFASVASILIVVTSFDLFQSIIRSKSEHAKDMDSFIWSILSLSTIWTLFVYGLFLAFPEFFGGLLEMDWKYIHLMFWYLLAAPPYTMLITKQRAFYQYKKFVLLTGVMVVSGTLLSLVLVLLMQDKLTGRLLGFYSPYIIFGVTIFVYLACKGKHIRLKYWKYATTLCLPLVPHDLSLHILGVSDIVLITRLCGQEYTAYYSIAYSAYHIATVFFDALNKAWAPWLLDNLHIKNYELIRKISKKYILIFVLIITGILLLVPEIILILGGRQYERSIYCLPALIASCSFLFIFTMYVNIEFYEKKTIGVSAATMVGAGINIALNLILLPISPENSFIIAAYTTLFGYIVLFIIHYCIVRHMKMDHVYDIRFILTVLVGILVLSGLMNTLYSHTLIRWCVIVAYSGLVLYLFIKYKSQIIGILKKS